MELTKVRVRKLSNIKPYYGGSKTQSIVAYASIVLDDSLAIHSIAIVKDGNKMFCDFYRQKLPDGS